MAKKSKKHKKERRSFAGAKFTRLTSDWLVSGASQDSELSTSLRSLRNRSRELVRNNDYANGAVRTIVNNVVGTGVGFQSQIRTKRSGELDDKLNTQIEEAWAEWCAARYCHTAGKLNFSDIERLVMRSLIESGEVLVRLVRKSFGGSPIPLALEVIEADQLNDNYTVGNYQGNTIKLGVELDQWCRPVAYWLYPYHPGDFQFQSTIKGANLLRIPAPEILHLFLTDRPGQTRGVPWFHSALLRLHNVQGYEEAEIIAARVQACVSGFIQSPDQDAFTDSVEADGTAISNLSPGAIERLAPGEVFQGFAPTRPNTGFDPFVRMMLRGVASGLGISYESLSRDFSNTSYSSARTALLEERDSYRSIQNWFTQNFHTPIYEAWLDLAVLSGRIALPNYELQHSFYCRPKFTCRGWSWVDPLKEVKANQEAIASGLDSLTNLISQSGRDIEDVFKERQRELALAAKYGISLTGQPTSDLILPD